jgi:hypothetical protein
VTADDSRHPATGAGDTEPADEASVDRALGVALDELIDAIHETKQASWVTLDTEQHRALEALRIFLVEQAVQVGAAEAGIDGRSPLLVSPAGHRLKNLAAEAHGDQAAVLEILLADLERLAADVRRQAELIPGRDETQLLTDMADGLEKRLPALRP